MKRMKVFLSAVAFAVLLASVFLPCISASAKGSGDVFTVTQYCSACNSPRGTSIVALEGSRAYVGSCASNDFPLGSTIYLEGYGELFVNDRMAKGGMIDIYMGDYGKCVCTQTWRARAWTVEDQVSVLEKPLDVTPIVGLPAMSGRLVM